jgi:hypothetical protein
VTLRLVSESAGEHGQEDLDDAALLNLVAVADSDALAALYRRHGTACYRLARHVTASDDLAQDAVQEAFIGYLFTCLTARARPGSVEVFGGALALRLSAAGWQDSHLACVPVVHRGVERLKRGLPSSK